MRGEGPGGIVYREEKESQVDEEALDQSSEVISNGGMKRGEGANKLGRSSPYPRNTPHTPSIPGMAYTIYE